MSVVLVLAKLEIYLRGAGIDFFQEAMMLTNVVPGGLDQAYLGVTVIQNMIGVFV